MLVLSRADQQGIWIGDDVYVTVLSIYRGRVKLGIEAPADVRIDREELRAPRRKGLGQPAKKQA
jgi:carbon storage regulator